MLLGTAGCAPAAGSEALAAAIDGTDGKHWELPLQPLSKDSVPEAYSPGMSPQLRNSVLGLVIGLVSAFQHVLRH